MIRKLASSAALACALLGSRSAGAFLIVGTDAAQAPGPQTRVLVLHENGRSIVAVMPAVRGPAKPLAVVVPLQAASVETFHTVPIPIFERTDKLAAPRLDELWELDPCELHPDQQAGPPAKSAAPAGSASAAASAAPAAGATVDGDYEISMLRGDDATNAAKWLTDHGYKLPDGAAEALAAVKPGTVFAVARIDGSRLAFDKEVARLPPLGFVVNGAVALPLGLAALGAPAGHEVVVDVLSPEARIEASNLLNVAVPTNLDLKDDAKGDVEGVLRAALDYTFEKSPGAAITEYTWLAASCEGCAPGAGVSAEDLLGLGAEKLPSSEDGSQREVAVEVPETLAAAPEGPPELKRAIAVCYSKALGEMRGLAGEATVTVQTGAGGEVTSAKTKDASAEALGKCVEEAARATKLKPSASGAIKAKFALVARSYLGQMVLSRLRVRAAKGAADLEVRAAAAIEGGREEGPSGEAEKKVYFAEQANNFRARYAVRHAWPGPLTCQEPKRGVWGPKPKNYPAGAPRPSGSASASAAASAAPSASGKAAAPSAAERKLASLLEGGALPDLSAYAIAFKAAEPPKPAVPPAASAAPSTSAAPPAASTAPANAAGGGCGCRVAAADPGPAAWGALGVIVAALWGARRRSRATRS